MNLPIGITIHVTYRSMGLDALSNLPDLPCRAAIVTGPPSSVSGLTPIYVFPPYTSPYGAQLDVEKVNSWHPVEACLSHEDLDRFQSGVMAVNSAIRALHG